MLSKSEPLAEGTVIMADDQFAGRGQFGNTWISAAGLNLTFSIYLRPSFLNLIAQFQLSIAVSIGVVNALNDYVAPGFKIKWPNDIYFQGAKIGGILIENTTASGNLKSSIIGIGINVNQRKFDSSLTKKISSLGNILQRDVDLVDLLDKICQSIEVQYLRLKSGKADAQLSHYLENLYQYAEQCNYRSLGNTFQGQITGVTAEGKLLVSQDGELHSYGLKEIEFLDNN